MSLSRFASADAVFQYNPSEIYQYETFHNLSIIKCQKIASMLRIRKVKSYKKEQLIQIILHKHNEKPLYSVVAYRILPYVVYFST